MLADYHVHSAFSDDSTYPMEQVVRDAIRINLDELCFTEHVDYGVKPDWDQPAGARLEDGHPVTNCPYPAHLDELDSMRERQGKQIRVARGLELGVQSHTIPAYERLLEEYGDRLDFTLLSIHQVGDREFWNGAFQKGRTQEEFTMAYYEELLQVVERFHGYSVVAHLDLIRRYDPTPGGPLPFSAVRDIVAEILSRVIADGRGIAAALSLGAEAVQLGTRFLSAKECNIHENYRKKVFKAGDTATVVTGRRLGHPVRSIKNQFAREYGKIEYTDISDEELDQFAAGRLRMAVVEGDEKEGCFLAGQSAGMVTKEQTCAEIIADLMQDADRVLGELRKWEK